MVSPSCGHSLNLLQVSWSPFHSYTINITVRRASISTPHHLLQHCLQYITMQMGSFLALRSSSPSKPSVHSLQDLGLTKIRRQGLEFAHYVIWKTQALMEILQGHTFTFAPGCSKSISKKRSDLCFLIAFSGMRLVSSIVSKLSVSSHFILAEFFENES